MGHHVITVTSAIRDEGTSYHYIPPSREVAVDPDVVQALSAIVTSREEQHIAGRTWTTDAYFRETSLRVATRRQEGCLTVEMEASALIAVSRFRGVRFGQYLYAGDDLTGEVWNDRNWWESPRRTHLFELAADAALTLIGEPISAA